MRLEKMIVLAALFCVVTRDVVAQTDCAAQHAQIAQTLKAVKSDADVPELEKLLRAVIATECAETRDYLTLRRVVQTRGEFAEAAELVAQAMTAKGAAQATGPLLLFRAADLARAGRTAEARELLRSGEAKQRIRDEWLTISEEQMVWLRLDPALPKDLLAAADAFEAGDETGAIYRRAAAVTALQRTFLNSVFGPDSAVLDSLGVALAAMPLDAFDVRTQMTALRAEAIAYGALHEPQHAIAALEQLFDLCYPDELRHPCPASGYAPVMLQSLFAFDADAGPQARVDYDNFHVAAHVALSAFSSVSWDRNGRRRATATEDDFLGFRTIEGKKYGGAVDAEEDRETILETMVINHDRRDIYDKVIETGTRRPQLLTKIYLAELAFPMQLGSLPRDPVAAPRQQFLGRPIEDIEAIVDRAHAIGAVDPITWDALDVGRREWTLVRRIWRLRLPDDAASRVWLRYHELLDASGR